MPESEKLLEFPEYGRHLLKTDSKQIFRSDKQRRLNFRGSIIFTNQ